MGLFSKKQQEREAFLDFPESLRSHLEQQGKKQEQRSSAIFCAAGGGMSGSFTRNCEN